MASPGTHNLDETQRRILAFVCRWVSPGSGEYESRQTLTGELRLALSEYDEACRGLIRFGLITTDQPLSGDCDFIAPTPAGRALNSTTK